MRGSQIPLSPLSWTNLQKYRGGLVGLQLFDRQADLEAGGSGFGLDAHVAAMFADGPLYAVEPEAQAEARCFGGEEGLEDAVLQLGWDAGTVVPHLDEEHVAGDLNAESDLAAILNGVESVFEQGHPYLIQFAGVGADVGKIRGVAALDFDVLQARLQHGQRVFEALRDVDLLDGRLV